MAKAAIGRQAELAKDMDWYALLVPPQKEFVAQEILKRQGYLTFVPFEKKWRFRSRYSQGKELRDYPMMPRYVFAAFRPVDDDGRALIPRWFDIFNLQIIKGVVGLHGVPKRINGIPALIRTYRNGLRRPDEEKFMRTHKEYAEGDLAIIKDPRFIDRIVTVDKIEDGRAWFKIELFNEQIELSLPADRLEAA